VNADGRVKLHCDYGGGVGGVEGVGVVGR